MSGYRLSAAAELDLTEIADYTTDVWGPAQANLYLDSLVECFLRIAENPRSGRSCDAVHPGFRRMEQGKHVIFYQPGGGGVLIGRILHQSMVPSRHELMERES